jgi:hypothetical protein
VVHQLTYYSKSTYKGGDPALLAQLRDILSSARHNNARANITGFLIFDKTCLFKFSKASASMWKKSTTKSRVIGVTVD